MDKYGIEHWITTDQYGNEVECFANKFAEVHTKRPICVCGEPMVETRELEWDCPKCGAHLEAEDVSRSINPDDYMTCNLEPDEDYGDTNIWKMTMVVELSLLVHRDTRLISFT